MQNVTVAHEGVNLAITIDVENTHDQHESELHGTIPAVDTTSITIAGEIISDGGVATSPTLSLTNAR